MNGTTTLVAYLAVAATLVSSARAQNPDLILTQAERDSILATYDNIFPIWGRKAIERGFELPAPAAVGLGFVWLRQDIVLDDLALSTGDNPTQPVPFIEVDPADAPVFTVPLRPDLWIFPFLNVYGLIGVVDVSTRVRVVEPVEFETTVDQQGLYGGFGLTGVVGIRRNFVAIDINWAWTQTEKLDFPVRGRLFTLRYGRAIEPKPGQRVAFWLGAMNQHLVSETLGSIALGEVFDPGGADSVRQALAEYQQSAEYQALPASERATVDGFAAGLQQADWQDVTVNYGINKKVADPWNMIVGSSWDLDRHWGFRVEAGFIGRRQFLFYTNYRFDL